MKQNKIIFSKNLNELNEMIAKENRNGWVVKHLFCFGEGGGLGRFTGFYCLLEKGA